MENQEQNRIAISENLARSELTVSKNELLNLLESEISKRYLLVLVWRGSGEKFRVGIGFPDSRYRRILQALGLIQTYCGRFQNGFRIGRCSRS